jgi:hypothetical protein
VLEDVQRLTAGTLSVISQHLLELSRACDVGLESLCLRGYGPVPLSGQRCLVCLSAQPDSRTLPTNLRVKLDEDIIKITENFISLNDCNKKKSSPQLTYEAFKNSLFLCSLLKEFLSMFLSFSTNLQPLSYLHDYARRL